jgi:hypothetical protein
LIVPQRVRGDVVQVPRDPEPLLLDPAPGFLVARPLGQLQAFQEYPRVRPPVAESLGGG